MTKQQKERCMNIQLILAWGKGEYKEDLNKMSLSDLDIIYKKLYYEKLSAL